LTTPQGAGEHDALNAGRAALIEQDAGDGVELSPRRAHVVRK
jgi:hypothetical protein